MVSADDPPNSKHEEVCIHFKKLLPLRIINVNYLKECLRFELKISGKLCNFISLCRSPSQTQDELETFTSNLEIYLDLAVRNNPHLVVVLDNFNAKSKF